MKKLTYIIAFILSFVCLLSLSIFAESDTIQEDVTYTYEGIEWVADINITQGNATIVSANISQRTNAFTMPDTIEYEGNSYTVIAIGDKAFENKTLVFGKLILPKNLQSIGSSAFAKTNIYSDVVLPESLTSLGSSAFSECRGILTIKLPSSMKKIPSKAFFNCFSLTAVYSDSVIEEFASECFSSCYALHDIKIGAGTTKIESNAFLNCRGLDGKLDLSTVTSLANNAFQKSFNITALRLPDIEALDLATFSGCYKIASYEVVSTTGYTYFNSLDGVLYNSDFTTLKRYPIEKEGMSFTIPDSVTAIEANAFDGAYHLGGLLLNKNLKNIGDYAFKETGISCLYIPDSVTSFGTDVLANCDNLEWVVISRYVSSAPNVVKDCDNIELVIGRNPTFTTTDTGNLGVTKRAGEYTCTSHIYGYLDDTASCTESGINTCIICDRSSFVKPTGHVGTIIERGELSCTTNSYIKVNCTKCLNSEAITIFEVAPGHTSTPVTVAPTDTTPGFTIESCTVCGQTEISNYVASFYLLGDLNDDGYVSQIDVRLLANYLGNASYALNPLSCDINGDSVVDLYDLILLSRFIAKLDETLPESKNECEKHFHIASETASVASCIDDGIVFFYCLDCGALVDTDVTPKTGHDWEIDVMSSTEPSCLNSGRKPATCKVCKVSTVLIEEKLPHTHSWWTLPLSKGFEYSRCSVCQTFESREVDYSEFDELVSQLPAHYDVYYNGASLALINPILENHELALTQEQVDKNVASFKEVFPRLQCIVHDVPVIYINSLAGNMLDDDKDGRQYVDAEIIVAYYDEDGNYATYIEKNAEAKIRGNSTAGKSKKPYNIKFSTNVNLFGLGEDNKYCLLANAIEPALLRNALVRQFNTDAGVGYACKYEFVDVYSDGRYRGSYLMSTPVDIEETRIDIDEETDAILEIENTFAEGDFYFDKGKYAPFFHMRFQIANGNDLSGEGYSRVFSTLCQLEYAIISGDIKEIEKYADIDSLASYYVLVDYFKDVDFVYDSTRFYIEDGKLHGGPAWDYDRSSGHANVSSYRAAYNNMTFTSNGFSGDSTTGEWANTAATGLPNASWTKYLSDNYWITSSNLEHDNHTWLAYLYQCSPDFVNKVSDKVFELNKTMTLVYKDYVDDLGKVTKNNIDIIYLNEDIYDSFVRNNTIWSIPANSDEGWSFTTHKEAIDQLRNWLADRHQWMINHYSGKQLADYCASIADRVLLDPNITDLANITTTSVTDVGDNHYRYTVDYNFTSEDYIKYVGVLERTTYSQVEEIFASNLSYADVLVNIRFNDSIVTYHSDMDVANTVYGSVKETLLSPGTNIYSETTNVSFTNDNGDLFVKLTIAPTDGISENDAKAHAKSMTNLIKRAFEKANFYVCVDIEYVVNNNVKYLFGNGYIVPIVECVFKSVFDDVMDNSFNPYSDTTKVKLEKKDNNVNITIDIYLEEDISDEEKTALNEKFITLFTKAYKTTSYVPKPTINYTVVK